MPSRKIKHRGNRRKGRGRHQRNNNNKCRNKSNKSTKHSHQSQRSHWNIQQNKQNKSVNDTTNQSFIDSNYVQRINKLLKMVENINNFDDDENKNNNNNNNDIYDIVCNQYPEENINYFIMDYHHYVQQIDKNKIYTKNIDSCDIENCPHIAREYRDKTIHDKNINFRYKLYNKCKSKKSIIIQQFFDQIHIIKEHLIHLGLRYIDNGEYKMDIDSNNDCHQILVRMKKDLKIKRQKFNKIRKDINNNNKKNKYKNKFITKIIDEEEKQQYIQYSFGVKYYYHSYYKHNTSKTEIIPGSDGWPDDGNYEINGSYTFSSWFIIPTQKSVKEEVLNNKQERITMIEFDETVEKARMKLNGLKHIIAGSHYQFEIVYSLKRGSPITLQHILSIMLYTNYTALSAQFSSSFRKVSKTESDESLKQRHSEWGNWAKYLRETVDLYGEYMQHSKETKPLFHHGISCKMLFKGFNAKFGGPTSTTLQYSTAVMFANQGDGDGIIITIKNNGSASLFFDCRSWSDFPAESEMFFLSTVSPLEIIGLTEVSEGINHNKWIQSIKKFETGLILGAASMDNILIEDKERMDVLMNDVINKENDNKNNKLIPLYIQTLFKYLINKTKCIEIDIGILNKHIFCRDNYHGTFYGFKILKHIYYDNDDKLKWNVITQLFPSLEIIRIQHIHKIQNVPNGFKWSPSLKLTDDILLSILSNIKNKGIQIYIYYPENSKSSLTSLINDYSASYKQFNYKLQIDKINAPQYGVCTTFGIIPL